MYQEGNKNQEIAFENLQDSYSKIKRRKKTNKNKACLCNLPKTKFCIFKKF